MPSSSDPTPRHRASRPADAISTLASLLFITWCFVVGTLLLYAPWMPVWARITASFSDPALQQLLAHPTLRGAICGFGLFHLVYGTHDLDAIIGRFLLHRLEKMEAAEAEAGEGEIATEVAATEAGLAEGGSAADTAADQPGARLRGEP